MHLGALFHLNFSCALLPMVSSPFASPWGVSNFEAFYLGCVEPLPLPWGTEIFLSEVIFSWLLFGWAESKQRTRRSHTSTRNTENTTSLYWFGPPESKTLCPVVGVDFLGIAYVTWGRLARLILASGWGWFLDS
jgi:hypothetical protein